MERPKRTPVRKGRKKNDARESIVYLVCGLEGSDQAGVAAIFTRCLESFPEFTPRGVDDVIGSHLGGVVSKLTLSSSEENESEIEAIFRRKAIYYLDSSFPCGYSKREIGDQKDLVRIYELLSKYANVVIIHLERDLMSTVVHGYVPGMSTPDGDLQAHAQRLRETQVCLLSQLQTLEARGVQIQKVIQETVNDPDEAERLAGILRVDSRLFAQHCVSLEASQCSNLPNSIAEEVKEILAPAFPSPALSS